MFTVVVSCLVATIATLSITASSSIKLADLNATVLSKLSQSFCKVVYHGNIQPVMEPEYIWHDNTPNFINVTVTLHTLEPLYVIKALETVIPEHCGEAYVLLGSKSTRKVFHLSQFVSGVVVYRKFLELDFTDVPLTLNVSYSRNRKV